MLTPVINTTVTVSLRQVLALKGLCSGSMTDTFQQQGQRSDVKFNIRELLAD
jgi:hypothetical protein